jgi:hypothetical protein
VDRERPCAFISMAWRAREGIASALIHQFLSDELSAHDILGML